MGEFKYKTESALKELKSLLDEAVKFEEENDRLKKEIIEMEKQHAKELASMKQK
ncbi:MAG: hypothetical protein WC643_01435 [Parcubacteria group bacterium]|jgi:hypothetical protein